MSNKLPVFRLYPGEFGYLAIILVVSGYMWYGSYEYDSLAGFFPRFIAIITIVLTLPLLVRRMPFVPNVVREKIEGAGTGTLTDQASDSIDVDQDEDEQVEEEETELVERTSTTRKTNVLGLLTGGYMVLGFLFGLLWATPPFVVAYLWYTGKPWKINLGIAAIVTAIVYNMMTIFNFTLETGWAFDKLGIEIPLSLGVGNPQLSLLLTEVVTYV